MEPRIPSVQRWTDHEPAQRCKGGETAPIYAVSVLADRLRAVSGRSAASRSSSSSSGKSSSFTWHAKSPMPLMHPEVTACEANLHMRRPWRRRTKWMRTGGGGGTLVVSGRACSERSYAAKALRNIALYTISLLTINRSNAHISSLNCAGKIRMAASQSTAATLISEFSRPAISEIIAVAFKSRQYLLQPDHGIFSGGAPVAGFAETACSGKLSARPTLDTNNIPWSVPTSEACASMQCTRWNL